MSEYVERITFVGRWWQKKRIQAEPVELSEEATVRRWLRELAPGQDVTIMVHRSWGAVVAVADGKGPVSVFLADDREMPLYAVAPGAPKDQHLTPDQVEDILVDALTSAVPPEWPDWHAL
jgi:hypothetical protein